jgi:hypothetical protein
VVLRREGPVFQSRDRVAACSRRRCPRWRPAAGPAGDRPPKPTTLTTVTASRPFTNNEGCIKPRTLPCLAPCLPRECLGRRCLPAISRRQPGKHQARQHTAAVSPLLQLPLRSQGRTFGAPSLTARPGHAMRRVRPGTSRGGRDDPMEAGQSRRGLAVAGRQLRSRPSGRQPYGRGGCRARLPRHWPQPVPAATAPDAAPTRAGLGRQHRAMCANRRAKVTGPWTERRALSESAPPTSRAPEDRF